MFGEYVTEYRTEELDSNHGPLVCGEDILRSLQPAVNIDWVCRLEHSTANLNEKSGVFLYGLRVCLP